MIVGAALSSVAFGGVALGSAALGGGTTWLWQRRATPTVTAPTPTPTPSEQAPVTAGPAAPPPHDDETPDNGISAAVDGGTGPAWSVVVDKLPLGVVVMSRDGEVSFRNRRANAMAGTHTGLLVDNAVKEALSRARRGEHTSRLVELYGPPQMAVVVAAEPLTDGAAVATIEDVSERRRLDAVRTDFVANISHELKTPVGALAVLAEALAEEDDPDVVNRVADRMVSEAHRVAGTIDDLMELSRIELGEEPVRDAVSVHDLVAGAIERASGLAESKGIQIAVLDPPDDVVLIGDRRQLISALGNLVENAVKYSGDGSTVQIRVRVDRAFAELMVADQGIGIPAAAHDRIFERFYRVDKARGRDTGGTGLGLSIVRHVATNHGGEVLLSSQEGEGSTFVLRLPLSGADGASRAGQRATPSTESPADQTTRSQA